MPIVVSLYFMEPGAFLLTSIDVVHSIVRYIVDRVPYQKERPDSGVDNWIVEDYERFEYHVNR